MKQTQFQDQFHISVISGLTILDSRQGRRKNKKKDNGRKKKWRTSCRYNSKRARAIRIGKFITEI
jgi:hypothetical protein